MILPTHPKYFPQNSDTDEKLSYKTKYVSVKVIIFFPQNNKF